MIVKSARPRFELSTLSHKIVAYGEATGHKHEFEGDAKLLASGDRMFAEVSEAAQLVHNEHDTIEIPEGFYKVVRQREFDGEQIRIVAD